MIELFADLPEEVKEKTKLIIDFVINNFTPQQGIEFLSNYLNSCNDEQEKQFIDFYFSLRMAQILDEDNNDKR